MKKQQEVKPVQIDPSHLQCLSVLDAARLLGVGRTTVYALINAHEIESVLILGARRILIVSLSRYLERQKRAHL
jgi:excisionase family DNA binding protein